MPLYEYKCEEGHVSEYLSNISTRTNSKVCKMCEKEASYIISTPTVELEGITGDFPGAYAKWEKNHMQKLKVERKRKHG